MTVANYLTVASTSSVCRDVANSNTVTRQVLERFLVFRDRSPQAFMPGNYSNFWYEARSAWAFLP